MKLTGTPAILTLALFIGAWPSHAAGQSGKAPASPQEPSAAQTYFTDTLLINQDGKSVRFYSDLLKDRTVVINNFFTECTTGCTSLSRNMQAIQDWLGNRLNWDVLLLSISVDPATDTPARIKEYAQRFHARPGWVFLTGKKENVALILQKLGRNVESRDDHSTIFLIGNDRTHLWKKATGLAKASDLIRVVASVVNDKGE